MTIWVDPGRGIRTTRSSEEVLYADVPYSFSPRFRWVQRITVSHWSDGREDPDGFVGGEMTRDGEVGMCRSSWAGAIYEERIPNSTREAYNMPARALNNEGSWSSEIARWSSG